MRRTTAWRGSCAVAAAGVLTLGLVGPGPPGATTATAVETVEGDHLTTVEAALARGDLGAAGRAAQQAYLSARGARSWESMVAAGDAYRRLAEVSTLRARAIVKARDAYLAGLFRARQAPSLPGVFRIAEAFAALGDRDLVNTCVRVAETVATQVAD